MIIYHGSKKIIEKPAYGLGKKFNDYGQGFNCTKDIELAKEWACNDPKGGFINAYSLNTDSLKILNLNDKSILEWLSILLEYRKIRYSSPVEKRTADYLRSNFLPDLSGYDVITGYRADDSYFSFARAFLSNTISLEQLSYSMKFGDLGIQIFIKSDKAFENLHYIESDSVSGNEYFPKRMNRDNAARLKYNKMLEENVTEGIFARDILRKEPDLNEFCL